MKLAEPGRVDLAPRSRPHGSRRTQAHDPRTALAAPLKASLKVVEDALSGRSAEWLETRRQRAGE